MFSLFKLIRNFVINILVFVVNIFIKRNNKVILFGSWMGDRFADNSRFLFQYLNDNKAHYCIEHIVWVTDNEALLKELRAFNYDVYLKNSLRGIYWHLKAGVHIVCNKYASDGKYKGDIIGELSAGSIKIQLWHGVAIKACGKLTQSYQALYKTKLGKIRILLSSRSFFGRSIFTPGCWNKRYHLCTSNENARVAIEDYDVLEDHIILSNYPRLNDDVVKLLEVEKKTINSLTIKKSHYSNIILYCPTFRNIAQSESRYINPLSSETFLKFLEANNLLWVEKRHAVSKYSFEMAPSNNVFFIESNFDISLLYKFVDLAITDFSSAASDCVYRGIKVLSYIPDFDEYKTNDRGFVAPYSCYYPGDIATSLKELEKGIITAFSPSYFSDERRERYNHCREFLFEGHSNSLDEIIKAIFNSIHI